MTSLSYSHIRRLVSQGAFPRPVCLGPHTRAWRLAEIEHWLRDRVREREALAERFRIRPGARKGRLPTLPAGDLPPDPLAEPPRRRRKAAPAAVEPERNRAEPESRPPPLRDLPPPLARKIAERERAHGVLMEGEE